MKTWWMLDIWYVQKHSHNLNGAIITSLKFPLGRRSSALPTPVTELLVRQREFDF